jgi:Icc-related predicted phosphoesterase
MAIKRLVFISDTHTLHSQITTSIIEARAEILVHCGDFSSTGKDHEVRDFADWLGMLRRKGYVKHCVVIAGNHDMVFDNTCPNALRMYPHAEDRGRIMAYVSNAGADYIEDDSLIVEGVSFYGVPWTPRFFDWAFQIDSPEQDAEIFARVPANTQVLITHGPAKGIRDLVPRGENIGSVALRAALDRIKPRIHAFGHIHETYGQQLLANGVLSVNASTCTGKYKPTNKPIVIDLEI